MSNNLEEILTTERLKKIMRFCSANHDILMGYARYFDVLAEEGGKPLRKEAASLLALKEDLEAYLEGQKGDAT